MSSIEVTNKTNCALFVDYENVYIALEEQRRESGSSIAVGDIVVRLLSRLKERVETELKMRLILGRAYGDWSGLTDAPSSLALMSIQPVYTLSRPNKNSADLELSLEAQEILLLRDDIQHFVIVGGDRDYIPIVRRIQEGGKGVTIVALEKAMSGDLRTIVGKQGFIPVESLDISVSQETKTAVTPEIKSTLDKGRLPKSRVKPVPSITLHSEIVQKEENIDRAIDLAIKATAGKESMEIPLVAFFKDYMNEAFLTLSNEQRKELIEVMRQKGVVSLEIREEPSGTDSTWHYDYIVMTVNSEHPLIKEKLKNA